MKVRPCISFVGFWEIATGDMIVFARSGDRQAPSRRSFPDIVEPGL